MTEPLSDQIAQKVKQAAELYHRLVLVVAQTGEGKTAALQDVRINTGAPLINVNLELSRRMLDLTERQRALRLPQILGEIVRRESDDLVLIDNTEIIFDVVLKQDPLRLLQGLSRSQTVVASWSGAIVENSLTYAIPDHPEYRRYPLRDFLFVSTCTTPET